MSPELLEDAVKRTIYVEHRLFLKKGVEITYTPVPMNDGYYRIYRYQSAERVAEYGPYYVATDAACKANELLEGRNA